MEPEKLCWWCKYFRYISAMQDWSDLTPGNDFGMVCHKSKWTFDAFESTQEDFRKCITAARTCSEFVQIEDLK